MKRPNLRKAELPGITWSAPFSLSESSKASHTERTGPPSMPQYLIDNTFSSTKRPKDYSRPSRILVYLMSWCQATYGRSSSALWELSAGYLQMKRESSRITSGPRTALTTCKIRGCLVKAMTQGYCRWTLCRLYWVYSIPTDNRHQLKHSQLFFCLISLYFWTYLIPLQVQRRHAWLPSAQSPSGQTELRGNPVWSRAPEVCQRVASLCAWQFRLWKSVGGEVNRSK